MNFILKISQSNNIRIVFRTFRTQMLWYKQATNKGIYCYFYYSMKEITSNQCKPASVKLFFNIYSNESFLPLTRGRAYLGYRL